MFQRNEESKVNLSDLAVTMEEKEEKEEKELKGVRKDVRMREIWKRVRYVME
jgi:hypothetical protein